jgi:hypothetical protein
MPRLYAFLLLPLAAVTLLVPSAFASSKPATAIQRTAAPKDAQIEAMIRTKLAKSKIGKDGFRFHVQRGVVTWEGSTNVMQHKGSATRMARAAGAVQVINNIEVNGSAKTRTTGNLKKAVVEQ